MNKLDCYYYKNITLEQALAGGSFKIRLDNDNKVKVKIKPGGYDGKILRLKDLGKLKDGQRGDALIELKIMEHPVYRIDKLDLKATLLLTPAEAEMGVIKKMPGPDGKAISVRVAPKTKEGSVITLKGYGFTKENSTGDLKYFVKIDTLEDLDEKYMPLLFKGADGNLH